MPVPRSRQHSQRAAHTRLREVCTSKQRMVASELAVYFGTSDGYWIDLQGHSDREMAKDEAGRQAARINPEAPVRRYSEPNTFLMSELACPSGSLRIWCSSSAMRLNNPSSALAVT